MKKFLTVVLAMILLSAATVHAEIKTYSGVGEYLITEETIDFAKHQAEISAERDILEQASVYVKTQATMTDHELDEDEIITIGAGLLHVTDTKFSIEDVAEGLLVKAFVTAEIDMDELITLLEQAINNRAAKN